MDDGGEKDFWFPTRSLFCWDFLKMAQTLIAGWKEPIGDYDFSWISVHSKTDAASDIKLARQEILIRKLMAKTGVTE